MYPDKIFFGNAYQDRNPKQWLLGSFIDQEKGLLHDQNVEIKWASHKAGEEKDYWTKSTKSKTISILIKGKIEILFPDKIYSLEKEGDCVIWGTDVMHTWKIIEDSLVVTIRWPSIPGQDIRINSLSV